MGYAQHVGPYNPKYHTIVRDYGYIEDTNEELARIDLEHVNNFPPVPGITFLTGWILPDGTFYSCHSQEHDAMARLVYKHLYQKIPGGYKEYSLIGHIEALGWLRVAETVVQYKDVALITKAQVETIFDLILSSGSEEFKEHATWVIEAYEERNL